MTQVVSDADEDGTPMLAMILKAHGDPENFESTDIPIPSVEPGKVLIRAAATSVNPIDIQIRQGLPIGAPLPAVIGADVSGIVEAIGPGVTGFGPGDAVYGCVGGIKGYGGTLAQYVLADARLLALKPRALSLRQAAALPLVGITAMEMMERTAIARGQHVLVHGGTGGVGHVAIQLAKAFGARVATTVSSGDAARVAEDLGADETIAYTREKPDAYVARLTGGHGFDIVFDTLGGDNLPASFGAARNWGQVATTNAHTTQDLSLLHAHGLSLHVIFMMLVQLAGERFEKRGRTLAEIARLVDAGSLRPLIDPTTFTLETAGDAHRYLESGKARGKVVIDIDPTT